MTHGPGAVRQIARRAREHVAARRLRVRVSRLEQQAVVERFLAAALLVKLLARADRVLGAFASATVWLNGAPAGPIEVSGQPAAVSLVVENWRVTSTSAGAAPSGLDREMKALRQR
jgi:RNA polymerase sigma-70 factor (ECF subfamily)